MKERKIAARAEFERLKSISRPDWPNEVRGSRAL
jgi:hypothetical protein